MSNETVAQLKALKLHGMAQSWPELLVQTRHSGFEPERMMELLLQAELADRQVRSIAYQMAVARFPAHRDLAATRVDDVRVAVADRHRTDRAAEETV